MLRKLKLQIPREPLAPRYNRCQGPVVEKHCSMTFAQRRNRLSTHFSERIPVVKRRISVTYTYLENSHEMSVMFATKTSRVNTVWGCSCCLLWELNDTLRSSSQSPLSVNVGSQYGPSPFLPISGHWKRIRTVDIYWEFDACVTVHH